jgi:hypothetical protein
MRVAHTVTAVTNYKPALPARRILKEMIARNADAQDVLERCLVNLLKDHTHAMFAVSVISTLADRKRIRVGQIWRNFPTTTHHVRVTLINAFPDKNAKKMEDFSNNSSTLRTIRAGFVCVRSRREGSAVDLPMVVKSAREACGKIVIRNVFPNRTVKFATRTINVANAKMGSASNYRLALKG